ncbi:MAG: fibrobacter succinogenes major paralogous domain-containing protein [Rikenellaceae bacterium]|nr:fibrobacter succinogenes major paralogous domain-containing protein [Rikenellaceae bacterium]
MPLSGDEASGCNPWSAFTAGNGPYRDGEQSVKGRLWNRSVCYGGTAWYPVTGERYSSSGEFFNGNNGSNWTSATKGAMAFYLYYNNVYINIYSFTDNGYYRAYGFSVRCVRE